MKMLEEVFLAGSFKPIYTYFHGVRLFMAAGKAGDS